MDGLTVHVGGSNRQLERTMKAFAATGISLYLIGYTGSGHFSNQFAVMPDTSHAKELLRRMKGTIPKKQWFKERQQPHFF